MSQNIPQGTPSNNALSQQDLERRNQDMHEDEHDTHQRQEQNPALLQWRANVLLDEMMLGAIDIAAGGSAPARMLSPIHSTSTPPELPQPPSTYQKTGYDFNGYPANGEGSVSLSPSHVIDQPSGYANPHDVVSRNDVDHLDYGNRPDVKEPVQSKPNGDKQPTPANGTEQWLFAAEQRYQQIAARRQATLRPTSATEYDGWSMVPAEEQNRSAQRFDQDSVSIFPSTSAPAVQHASLNGAGTSTPAAQANDTVASMQSQANPVSDNRNKRKSLRSNLLPRMNTQDSRSVQQEMNVLQNNIEAVLPAGHESRIRAQHLLQKAFAILQNDPTHSAEMDYYLQQVRTIVQRVQETVHWSSLYRSRLHAYLFSWLALSIIVVFSRYMYAAPISSWLGWLTSSAVDGLFIYNLLTIIAAFFFGALGGGAGALLNMMQHAQMDYGFFDRKYGLRGLILPLIGAFCGVLLSALFGLFYTLLNIDPATSIWLGLLPALLALVLGASQEYFYGVRT